MTPIDLGDHPAGLRRSAQLLRLYRREPDEPVPFYEFLARDTIMQLGRYGAKLDGVVADIGGGPGYLADAVRRGGGRCVVVEYQVEELHLHDREPHAALVGDGQQLGLRSGAADVVHSSNVLEHVPDPSRFIGEMVRMLAPSGIGYLSFTPWYSPWGGHETSPWHFVGGEYAAKRYARRHGVEAKNRYGTSLYELHLPPVRRALLANPAIEVLWDGPRYWPETWRLLSRVPVVGEALTWNHLTVFRRRPT